MDLVELKKILTYHPDIGVFFWSENRGSNKCVFKAAGYIPPDGYRRISINGKKYKASRLAWMFVFGVIPVGFIVDHIDGNPHNDAIDNLRCVSILENQQNQRKAQKNNKCGLLGVSYWKATNTYRAQIRVGGRKKTIGYYPTPQTAHQAYLETKREAHKGCTI